MRSVLFLLFTCICLPVIAEDLPANAGDWPKECQTGNKVSCYKHAKRLEEGNQINKNLPEALNFFQKACDLGLVEGCGDVGKMLFFGGEGITKDEEAAIPYTAKTCSMGYPDQVCWITAYILMEGKGSVKHDPARAQEYLFQGCKINDSRACGYGARLYSGYLDHVEQLKHIAQDGEKAFMFADRGCAGTSAIACSIGGWLSSGQLGIKKSIANAVQYYHKGCELRDGEACFNATAYQQQLDGGITDKNRKYLKGMSERGCALESGSACYQSARLDWLEGNKEKSLEGFLKSCDAGIGYGCQGASTYYSEIQNHNKSLELANKACKQGIQPMCGWEKELGDYLAELKRLEAEENAQAEIITAALNKKDYRSAINLAVNKLRSRSQAARVIQAADSAGKIGDIENIYIQNLLNWFAFSHSAANAIVQREYQKIVKAEKASQNYVRIAPVNSSYDDKAESLWEISKRNAAATEKREMDWYNRGGQASGSVQRSLAK